MIDGEGRHLGDEAEECAEGLAGGLPLAVAVLEILEDDIPGRGLRAGLRFRYLAARPAFDTDSPEYRSAVNRDAADYFVMDLYGAYRWRWLEAGFTIQNLTNTDWREAQVGNHSCTHDEAYNPAGAHYALCGVTMARWLASRRTETVGSRSKTSRPAAAR